MTPRSHRFRMVDQFLELCRVEARQEGIARRQRQGDECDDRDPDQDRDRDEDPTQDVRAHRAGLSEPATGR